MCVVQTLSEYIEDTEDLVNASLDATRNMLLAYDLFFLGINAISMVRFELRVFCWALEMLGFRSTLLVP
jgi:hypothetical protein